MTRFGLFSYYLPRGLNHWPVIVHGCPIAIRLSVDSSGLYKSNNFFESCVTLEFIVRLWKSKVRRKFFSFFGYGSEVLGWGPGICES